MSRDLKKLLIIQLVFAVAILGYLHFYFLPKVEKGGASAPTPTGKETAESNLMNARLNQIQMDVSMIKAKVGAGPAQQDINKNK